MDEVFEDLPALLPDPVRRAVALLREGGEPAWLVGGAARDLLLERPVKDFDFVIPGDGLRWARRIANMLGGAFVPLDEVRGVGRAVVQYQGKPLWIDVARFRGAGDTGDGASLQEDLNLRDFTLNAIALDPTTGALVDPTGGVADLRAGRLRAASPHAFQQDPLRILRGVRLAATRELTLVPETEADMRAAAPLLPTVAMERVRDEWLGLLAPPGAAARVEQLDALGALPWLLPELVACQGVTQSPPHSHDVYGHQLLVLEALEVQSAKRKGAEGEQEDDSGQSSIVNRQSSMSTPNSSHQIENLKSKIENHLEQEVAHELPRWLLLKHVALLHDLGKPPTRTVGGDGRIHFYDHDVVGAGMIEALMVRWKFAARAVAYAARVVRWHMRPLQLSNHLPPKARTVYRFFRDAGDMGPDVALLSLADQRGKAFATDRAEVVAVVERLLAAFFEEPERFVTVKPLLNGNEVMALTGQTGPAVGQLLEFLREQQAQGRIGTREEAERAVREWQGKGQKAKGKGQK